MSSADRLTIDQILAIRSRVTLEAPQWLNDETVAVVSDLGGTPELWGFHVAGGFPQRLTVGLGSVRFLGARLPTRSPDGKWIAYVADADEAAELWVWPTDGGASRQLTRLGANINALSWSPDSRTIALSGNRYGAFDIFRVEVPSGATTRLTSHSLYEVFPAFTPDGKSIVYVRMDERWADHEIICMSALGGAERVIVRDEDMFDYHFGRTFGYPLIAPDGKSLLFRSYRSGWMNYWRVSLAGGEPTPFCAEAADHTDAVWSPDGRWLAYCSNHNGTIDLRVASADGETQRMLVAPSLGVCAAPQWSPDGTRIAYLYQTPTAPLDLWVVSLQDGQARQLTNALIAGAAQRLITPQKIAYPSFDGRSINAYVYAPPQRKAGEKYPGLLWIHGGPAMQWFDDYYNYMQYFAQQGYVVLAPNVRGSTGYGKPFEMLNNADFGYGDLQDAIKGVAYLKTLDFVDAGKMAIAGTSYGGYMAAAAVVWAPGVFQAAIAASGYPDRVAMYDEQELRHIKQMEYKFGPFETHKHIYAKCSPARWAKQATTPCFVLHGEGKPPRSEGSKNFALALEKEYKTVQYKAYQGEGYYVQSPTNTRQLWLDMQAFLAKYLT